MLGGDIQWGRHAEVKFKNFDSGLVTTIKSNQIDNNNSIIGDGLRISFEYNKSDDQGYDTPNGKVVIYGLTEKTFNSIGERLRCELTVTAGYLKSTKNKPRRLFDAVLMDKSYEIQDGISVCTFTVLGDFIERQIAYKMSQNLPKATLVDIMLSISNAMGKSFEMRLDGNQQENSEMANYLQNWVVSPYGYSFANTPQQELKRIKESFGINHRIEKDTIVYSIEDSWFSWHLDGAKQISNLQKKQVNNTLVAENKTAEPAVETKPIEKNQNFNLMKTHALVLSPDTGLIGTPIIKTIIASKGYDAALAEGEEVWSKKEQKVLIDKKTGKPRTDKKTGEVKMSKKPKNMQVARRTVLAKCLINASLDFNAQVSLKTSTAITDGVYRVRKLKISGDTEGEEWYMELELNE